MAIQDRIQETIQTWQPYYEEPLTEADGLEILENWTAYVGLLAEWAAAAGEWEDPQ